MESLRYSIGKFKMITSLESIIVFLVYILAIPIIEVLIYHGFQFRFGLQPAICLNGIAYFPFLTISENRLLYLNSIKPTLVCESASWDKRILSTKWT
jgi:hypothetical protein